MRDSSFVKSSSRARILGWILAVGFGILAFTLNYELEQQFDKLGAFKDFNVLFDTDPIVQMQTFEEGVNPYGRNLSHPNLANLFNPPVRVLVEVLTRARLARVEDEDLRRQLALLVVPAASGLKAVVVFWFCVLMGLSLAQSSLVTFLGVVSFSQLLFGSIPDHWALGGLAISIAFLLAADLFRLQGRVRWWAWILVGTLAMSITTTNIMIVVAVLWVSAACASRRFLEPALHAFAVGAASLAITLILYWVGSAIYRVETLQTVKQLQKWTERHLEADPKGKVLQFPAAIINTIAPPNPVLAENRLGKDRRRKRGYQFTLDTDSMASIRRPIGLAVALLIGAGAILGLRGSTAQKALAWAALVVLLLNLILHSIWGQEYFLYSQHWHMAVLVLASTAFATRGRAPRAMIGLVGALAVAVSVNSVLRFEFMLDVLSRYSP